MGEALTVTGIMSIIGIPFVAWMLVSPSILIIMAFNSTASRFELFSRYPTAALCAVIAVLFCASMMLGVFSGNHAFVPHFGLKDEWTPVLRWWID